VRVRQIELHTWLVYIIAYVYIISASFSRLFGGLANVLPAQVRPEAVYFVAVVA
jgi:hypothetical protein